MKRKKKKIHEQESKERVFSGFEETESKVKRSEVERGGRPPMAKMVEESSGGETVVQSAWPGKIILPEAPSGTKYVWHYTGEVIGVANEDVEFVMGYNRSGRACCGSGGRTYFVIANQ